MYVKRKHKILIAIIIFLIVTPIFLWCENNMIQVSKYVVKSNKVSKEFEGYKILQISDLHSKYFGKNNERLISKIKNLKPNFIVFTGDLIDAHEERYDEGPLLSILEELNNKYPMVLVNGNHEVWSGNWNNFKCNIEKYNISVLEDSYVTLGKDKNMNIIGLNDYENISEVYRKLDYINKDINNKAFNILLSHRPEYIKAYSARGADLVFSGHAHGGQVRLPFIGGVVAPGQGYNPKYYEGVHNIDRCTMIVCRGLGNSIIPQRVFNKPELVLVELRRD